MPRGEAWFSQLVDDIASLKIQGAEGIARSAVMGLARLVAERGSVAVAREAQLLVAARPTEPMLRNAIAYYLVHATVENSQETLARILTSFDDGDKRIAAYAADLIREKHAYFTHCHSSTVIAALHLAHTRGKRFTVHNTETRPRMQGRMTAKDLAAAGIPVVHYVDSAARVALKGCSAVFLGADAILADGRVVNKIGSEMIAELAFERHIPVYILAHSWKYDPATANGFKERLENRAPDEVWAEAPHGVRVENPAFEIINPKLVRAIIFEQGLREPFTAVKEIQMRRTWLFPTGNAK